MKGPVADRVATRRRWYPADETNAKRPHHVHAPALPASRLLPALSPLPETLTRCRPDAVVREPRLVVEGVHRRRCPFLDSYPAAAGAWV